MSWWNWLGKPKTLTRVPEFVWLTREAALEGTARAVQNRAADGSLVLVVAHFPATLARVREALDRSRTHYAQPEGKQLMPDKLIRTAQQSGGCVLVPADALYTQLDPTGRIERSQSVAVVVAEHHPIRSPDEGIERFAAATGCPTTLEYHVSLEDPALMHFSGEWVGSMLKRLGMTETDPVQSEMVSRRIAQAQRKLEKTAMGNHAAESAEEWFRWNVPEGT